MKSLPHHNVKRIMKNAVMSKDMEVSKDSVELMRELAEQYIHYKTLKAMLIANDAGKRRITRAHVELTI
ncbi:MAG: NFYB/HAP3 family transcription factor subunit [Thermoplasmatales archaeon]|nr:NFYB/HAP3 family transcription factor subunit [Thermoplasmatales archaeon]